jgi:hypothetical protein
MAFGGASCGPKTLGRNGASPRPSFPCRQTYHARLAVVGYNARCRRTRSNALGILRELPNNRATGVELWPFSPSSPRGECHARFGKQDHTADDDVARVNFERLMALSTTDLAAELMPAFGSDGPKPGKDLNHLVLVSWLLGGYRGAGGVSSRLQPDRAVIEALQVLEHADLVTSRTTSPQRWNASRLGAAAWPTAITRNASRAGPADSRSRPEGTDGT